MKTDTKLLIPNLSPQKQRLIDTISGFHIEPTNICTLQCPGCARTQFIDQWPQHWKNHSLEIDALMNFLDLDLSNKQITLCGNYGDPIYHANLIEMISQFKQRGSNIVLVTNGSYKKATWWEQLVALLDPNDKITFSVDGTPDNFTQYRINADWKSILLAMQISAQGSCKTSWKYIPFRFNQHSIDHARTLSQQIGIDYFEVDPSDRYDENTEHLKPKTELIGLQFNSKTNWKQHQAVLEIDPKCTSGTEHYISAAGFYSPCCFIADHRFYYKNMFGQNKSQYNINTTTITKILNFPAVNNFFQTLESVTACQFNCAKTKSF